MFKKCILFFVIACSSAFAKPALTTVLNSSAIIEVYDQNMFLGIVLVERPKSYKGKAIPIGKVEYNESIENAARRQMLEELNLILFDLKQFYVYSDPFRDPKQHCVEAVHIAKAYSPPEVNSEATRVFIVKLEEIPWRELAFDHAKILRDYIENRNGKKLNSGDNGAYRTRSL